MTCFPHQIIMNHINIEKKAGGVLLYIRDSIQYQTRPDLQMAQYFIENIFIEIEIQCLNTTKNVIYRVQDSKIIFFQSGTFRHFTKKNTRKYKVIHLMDDYYNIDILKYSKNEYIQEFLDIVM